MNINHAFREKIKQNLQTSLQKYVNNFKYRKTQPLDLLIPTERKIRSVVGGLETSMGTTVWEPIAKALAEMNGFKIIDEKILKPKPFPPLLETELNTLVTLRENRDTWIPMNDCIKRLREISKRVDKHGIEYIKPAAGTGVDIRLKKGEKEYAFDTKTVQPNVGSIKSFNKQLLEWYAYILCQDPTVQISCKIAYPYNPHPDDFWSHKPHHLGILEPYVDAVVENEFWNFLSGEKNTYEEIIGIIKELRDEGFGLELSKLIEDIHTPSKSTGS